MRTRWRSGVREKGTPGVRAVCGASLIPGIGTGPQTRVTFVLSGQPEIRARLTPAQYHALKPIDSADVFLSDIDFLVRLSGRGPTADMHTHAYPVGCQAIEGVTMHIRIAQVVWISSDAPARPRTSPGRSLPLAGPDPFQVAGAGRSVAQELLEHQQGLGIACAGSSPPGANLLWRTG